MTLVNAVSVIARKRENEILDVTLAKNLNHKSELIREAIAPINLLTSRIVFRSCRGFRKWKNLKILTRKQSREEEFSIRLSHQKPTQNFAIEKNPDQRGQRNVRSVRNAA